MTGLWRHPDFVKLWLGQTISMLGSRITGNALPLAAVLALDATPVEMGLLTAAQTAPVLVLGLLVGVWVDRVRRRPVLVAADLGRAALLATIPAAALLGRLSMEHLYAVAVSTGVLTLCFDVSYRSYLPSLIRREDLVEGNSKLEVSSSAAEVLGPGLSGILVQLFTAPLAILLDAVSFLFSALSLALIRTPEPRAKQPADGQSVHRDVIEGLRVTLGNGVLRALAGAAATDVFFGSFIGTLYALYAIRDLGMSPALLGIVIATGGAGQLAGAISAGPVTRRFGLGPTLVGLTIAHGLMALLIPLAGGTVVMAASILIASQIVGDLAIAAYSVNEVSLRQSITPDRLLGRVNASTHFVVGGIGPLGALAGGVLGQALDLRPTLAVAAIGIILSCLWLLFSPVRSLRDQPASPT